MPENKHLNTLEQKLLPPEIFKPDFKRLINAKPSQLAVAQPCLEIERLFPGIYSNSMQSAHISPHTALIFAQVAPPIVVERSTKGKTKEYAVLSNTQALWFARSHPRLQLPCLLYDGQDQIGLALTGKIITPLLLGADRRVAFEIRDRFDEIMSSSNHILSRLAELLREILGVADRRSFAKLFLVESRPSVRKTPLQPSDLAKVEQQK